MSKQLKQIFSLFVSVVMIFSMFAGINFSVSAEDDVLDYLTWEINNGEVTITDCDESIIGDVVIPDTIEGYPVTVIGEYAFHGCRSFTSVIIPNSVTAIGAYAFYWCGCLKNVTISENVESIGYGAFFLNSSLQNITVDNNNRYYSSDEYGVLFNKDKTVLIQYPTGNERSEYTIPDCVIVIGDKAFDQNIFLQYIVIPDGVTSIGDESFCCCFSLQEINIPDSVTDIGAGAFAGCHSIKNIVLSDSITEIADETFWECLLLEYIEIPNSVTSIGVDVFDSCLSLESVSIPKGVTFIDHGAFGFCSSLTDIYIYNPEIELAESSILNDGFLFKNITIKEYANLAAAYILALALAENYDKYTDEELFEINSEFEKIIGEGPLRIKTDLVIHSYTGSTAEVYANEHGFEFIPICDHLNTETINTVTADCENNGYTGDVYCKDCEEIISDGETVPATDHDYIENIIKEPTFSQTGLKNDVCENCGDATAEEEIPQLTIEDSEEKENTDTDISIIYPDGTFDGEIEVEVTPVEEGEAYKLISHKQGNYKVTMFDINITVDGEKVQPDGTVLVKIPLPKGYNQNKCAVYYVADDGTMEELTTYHYKDGYVYFETDHFSYYAILETVENTPPEEDDTEISMSFFDKIIAFFKKIIEFIKNLFA